MENQYVLLPEEMISRNLFRQRDCRENCKTDDERNKA